METRIVPSSLEDAHIIRNLYPIYLHELSRYSGEPHLFPNKHGVLGEDDSVRCACSGTSQDTWWNKPGVCRPYIIYKGDGVAGFTLVATSPFCSPNSDFCLYEMFILNPYRGQGLGSLVAERILKENPGRWELHVLNRNTPALSFWRKLLARNTANGYVECESPAHAFADCTMFMFTTTD